MSTWDDHPEHDEMLAECFGKGRTGAETANDINFRFKTSYSRNAIIGRATRKGIHTTNVPKSNPTARKHRKRDKGTHERVYKPNGVSPAQYSKITGLIVTPGRMEPSQQPLRCVEVVPLNLSFADIDFQTQCHWPYGDGSAASPYTFCGHPLLEGSYCGPHLSLSQGPGSKGEQMAARSAA